MHTLKPIPSVSFSLSTLIFKFTSQRNAFGVSNKKVTFPKRSAKLLLFAQYNQELMFDLKPAAATHFTHIIALENQMPTKWIETEAIVRLSTFKRVTMIDSDVNISAWCKNGFCDHFRDICCVELFSSHSILRPLSVCDSAAPTISYVETKQNDQTKNYFRASIIYHISISKMVINSHFQIAFRSKLAAEIWF